MINPTTVILSEDFSPSRRICGSIGSERHETGNSKLETGFHGTSCLCPSKYFLLRAAQRRGTLPLVRGDMRVLAFRDGAFDTVVNLFTSFGYFDRDEQHFAVLQEVARVLARGGRFAMDFLNASMVKQSLVRRNSGRLGEQRVVQERRLSDDGRFVIKTIALEGEGRQFMERVRLYERADLEAMARGRPIVATAVGGVADALEDGVTGTLVPPNDVGALAAALEQLFEALEVERALLDPQPVAERLRLDRRRTQCPA